MLTAAGFTSSHKLTLKYLYRSDSQGGTKLFLNVQAQLNALGNVNVVGVPTNQSDFYGKYLYATASPSPAATGAWDFTGRAGARTGTGTAVTWFNPLFSSPGGFPPNGGSNFGYFSNADGQLAGQPGACPDHRGRRPTCTGPRPTRRS